MHLASLLTLIALPLSLAKNISISVGQDGLMFNPEVVPADVGDLLQFHFYPKNHSVAQSSASSPCKPSTAGVYSGFMPVTAQGERVFQVTVNSTDAMYFYCAQITHCQNGMSMVVNPPLTGDVLASYKTAAKNTSTVAPPTIAGGVFIDATGNSTSTTSTTSTSDSSSTASSTSTSSTTSSTSSTAPSKGGAAGNTFTQCGILGWVGVSGLVLAFML